MMSLNGPYPCIADLSEMVRSYKENYEMISAKIKDVEATLRKLKEERNAVRRNFHMSAEETMHLYGLRRFEGDGYVTELVTAEKPDICKEDFVAEYQEVLNWLKKQLPDYVEITLKPKLTVLKTMTGTELPGWCRMKSTTSISVRKIDSSKRYRRAELMTADADTMISTSPCTVSEMVSRINAAGILTESADAVSINRWLIHEGLIENDPVLGRRCKAPTALGTSFGIMLREGKRNDGKAYRIPIYSTAAQQFIIDNLDGFVEFLNRGR